MSKIKKLSPQVVARIAAGEVIERAAYVVKELVENAIDANATSIRIEIEKSGLEKIVVMDNGDGMIKQDVMECFKEHTTSKITSENDLDGIKSLGFRGEALCSIAAVSCLIIKSKTEKEIAGTMVELCDGKIQESGPVGMAKGTIVEVQQLFNAVPARKKFLKSSSSEFKYILEIITQYAIAFPYLYISFYNNKKKVFNLPKNQSLEQRIQWLLGDNVFTQLVPLTSESPYSKISGFISKPQLSSAVQKSYLFVNGRSVKDKKIAAAIKSTYGTLLAPETFPLLVVFIILPFEMVDVNVHPRKQEIVFHNEQFIHQVICQAVSESLQKYNLTYTDARWKNNKYPLSFEKKSMVRDGGTKTYAAEVLKQKDGPWQLKNSLKIKNRNSIIQLHKLYIFIETETGFLIIDQHAAHERILYEQFKEKLNIHQKKKQQFKLDKQLEIKLSVVEEITFKDSLHVLKQMGFSIKQSKSVLEVAAVPLLFKDRNITELVRGIIDAEINEAEVTTDLKTQRLLAYLACRTAVKAGDFLTKYQCRDLVEKLQKTQNYSTCPHGRPTQIEISVQELAKNFKRT